MDCNPYGACKYQQYVIRRVLHTFQLITVRPASFAAALSAAFVDEMSHDASASFKHPHAPK